VVIRLGFGPARMASTQEHLISIWTDSASP
jgi:hypothetical protein